MNAVPQAGSAPAARSVGPPLWLLLELTYRCPLHCVFCYNPTDFANTAAELPTAAWLRVLREAGLVDVEQDAQRRIYSLQPRPLAELDDWLAPYRALWGSRLDALHTEIARGRRQKESDS